MVKVRLPLAVYGKPSEAGADAGGYRFLVRHPAFDPPPMDRALRRLVSALEWRSSPHRHPPVHGLLREGKFTLVARFLDTGRDATGRPHALRVECALLCAPPPSTEFPFLGGWGLIVGDQLEISEECAHRAAPAFVPDEGAIVLVGDAARYSRVPGSVVTRIPRADIDGSSATTDT